MLIRFILFTLVMTKEEVNKLHEELNELSALEEQNLERMVEIAKILNAYYMWWQQWNVKSVENKSSEKTLNRNTVSDVET